MSTALRNVQMASRDRNEASRFSENGKLKLTPRVGSRVAYSCPDSSVGDLIVGTVKWILNHSLTGQILQAVVEFPQPMKKFFPNQHPKWDESGRWGLLKVCECKPMCGVLLNELDLFSPNLFTLEPKPAECRRNTLVPRNLEMSETIEVRFHNGNKIAPPIRMPPGCPDASLEIDGLGIFGRNNSCYVDALLMSLFAFHTKFDFILESDSDSENKRQGMMSDQEIMSYNIRHSLRCYIVNPLRILTFCPSQNVKQLRVLLSEVNSKTNSAMMDVEEFARILFESLRLGPFFRYISDMDDFVHQILCDTSLETLPKVIDTQTLLELSMIEQKLEWIVAPFPALFLTMPRSAGSLSYFEQIIPSPTVDVSAFIVNNNRFCTICGDPANFHCGDCFDWVGNSGMKSTYFCPSCIGPFHRHPARVSHSYRSFENQPCTSSSSPRSVLSLMAVICIRALHFVAFLRTGEGADVDWVLYDSNPLGQYPKVKILPNLMKYVEAYQEHPERRSSIWKSRQTSSEFKRLLTDGYIFVYC